MTATKYIIDWFLTIHDENILFLVYGCVAVHILCTSGPSTTAMFII